jgi:hypothetical protein
MVLIIFYAQKYEEFFIVLLKIFPFGKHFYFPCGRSSFIATRFVNFFKP